VQRDLTDLGCYIKVINNVQVGFVCVVTGNFVKSLFRVPFSDACARSHRSRLNSHHAVYGHLVMMACNPTFFAPPLLISRAASEAINNLVFFFLHP